MAKRAYIGVDGKARKVKKIYLGVEEKARKVKKAYAGIGGVARPIFSSGLEYYGPIAPLSDTREFLAATTVGDYALFGGGDYTKVVDAYDKSLTRSTPSPFSKTRYDFAATTVGDYALFGGGNFGPDIVDAYNKSLTRSTPTPFSEPRAQLAATTVGDYALFGGGYLYSRYASTGTVIYATVDAYDKSLTRSTATPLNEGRCYHAATSVGGYAIFGGGRPHYTEHPIKTSTVEVYTVN